MSGTITPQIIYKVKQMEKFPEIYTDALKRLTETGHSRVLVNDLLGTRKEIVTGNEQGKSPKCIYL